MTNKEAAERILELDKKATPGPWSAECSNGVELEHNDYVATSDGTTLLYGSDEWCDYSLVAESRTLSPQVAKAYLESLNLLRQLRSTTTEFEQTLMLQNIDRFLEDQ